MAHLLVCNLSIEVLEAQETPSALRVLNAREFFGELVVIVKSFSIGIVLIQEAARRVFEFQFKVDEAWLAFLGCGIWGRRVVVCRDVALGCFELGDASFVGSFARGGIGGEIIMINRVVVKARAVDLERVIVKKGVATGAPHLRATLGLLDVNITRRALLRSLANPNHRGCRIIRANMRLS